MSVTLLHGDSLDLMRELPDNSADAILADLPYGTTACKWDTVIPFAPLWEAYRRIIKRNGAIVLTASQPFTSALVMSNPEWFRYEWVWNKMQPTGHLNTARQPMRVCESVLVFYAEQPTYHPQYGTGKPNKRTPGADRGKFPTDVYGAFKSTGIPSTEIRQPTTLLTISSGRSPNNRTVHPTQKPVALGEYLIRTYTNKGETVLDNTMGSGSFGVAAVRSGRSFIGMESDPQYFAIAEKRIAEAVERESFNLFAPEVL